MLQSATKPVLLILEDDRRRINKFHSVTRKSVPDLNVQIHTTAPGFIAAIQAVLDYRGPSSPDLKLFLSLDHDLDEGNCPYESNHQSGTEVVDFLCTQFLRMPTVVHSANRDEGDSMAKKLRKKGFETERIRPFADLSWIKWDWLPVISRWFSRQPKS